MTHEELKNVVEQRLGDPKVVGRLACNLHSSDPLEQQHHDGRSFLVTWDDDGDYWRCTVTDAASAQPLAQIDLHENQTIRTDAFAPCRVTVSPEENLLCITRYR